MSESGADLQDEWWDGCREASGQKSFHVGYITSSRA